MSEPFGSGPMTSTAAVASERPKRSGDLRALLEKKVRQRLAAAKQRSIPRRNDSGSANVSLAQRRLWFLDRYEPNSSAYNIFRAFTLEGSLDVTALTMALSGLLHRQQALANVFVRRGDQPVQRFAPRPALVPVIDLSTLSAPRHRQEAQRRAVGEAQQPFDLSSGPLLRLTLLRHSNSEHVLLLTVHHIVSDGGSMAILWRELGELYAAATEGRPATLPELPIQYVDYATWEARRFQGDAASALIDAWRTRLAGVPPVLELPTDRPRPPVRTSAGGRIDAQLDSAVVEPARRLAKESETTLFMVMLAAWAVLLYRVTGQRDFTLGTPVAGRDRPELEGLVGLFVNTLVLRLEIAGEPTFSEFLTRVRRQMLDAHRHRQLPLEKLVEELAPERSLSYTPLFQVMMTLYAREPRPLELPDLHTSALAVERREARVDLELEIADDGEGLELLLAYSRDLFDRSTVRRWLESLTTLLRSIGEGDPRLTRLPLLSVAEQQQTLVEWNDTSTPTSLACLHELIAAQAASTPEAVAVVGDGHRLTYRQLIADAAQLAACLEITPESRVAVCLERSPAMVVALLGVLRAGGAYVPLDPVYPKQRLAYMLADCGAAHVITERALRDRLPTDLPGVLYLDETTSAAANETTTPGRSTPDQLAYLIYTSGSTGHPKGVMIPHRPLVNFLQSMAGEPGLRPEDRLLAVTTLSFDIAGLELFLPLLVGAQVVVAPREIVADGPRLAEWLEKAAITVMQATPATWQLLLESGWSGDPRLRIFCGGEALPRELAARLLMTGSELWNLYGPTETTIWSAASRVTPGDRPVAIGGPIANTEIYVVDRELQPVAIGVPGELTIGGGGLARGYFERSGLSAERFVPDHLSARSGARLYRTGDLVRWRTDQHLDFLGRVDHQVKIRGFRIELGEVAAALLGHPAVDEAVAIAHDRAAGDRWLVAYWSGDEAPDVRLEDWLSERLPSHLVPAVFVHLDALPRTPNGKIDRRALPDPGSRHDAAELVAPRTPTEEVLAGLWTELLAVERVGVDDHFFDLGGHSLLATRLVSRIRTAFDVELPVRRVFEMSRLADLAAEIDRATQRPETAVAAPPIRPALRDQALPLSFGQERLWFLDRLLPDRAVYNIATASRQRGPLDVATLEAAMAALAERHDVLRTTFPVVDGQPRQTVAAATPLAVPRVDLGALPARRRLALARRLAGNEAARPFELDRGPLWRTLLVRLAEDDYILLLTLHHTVADGWSLRLIDRELRELYSAVRQAREPNLPTLPCQYADYSVWQRDWLLAGELERQLDYWSQRFKGVNATLELPISGPRPALQSHRGAIRRQPLPVALGTALRSLGGGSGATFFMTLLAAFKTLLWRVSRQADLVVGTPIANRRHHETEGLIGLFVNFLGLRTQVAGDPTFLDLITRVRDGALGAYAHQDLPFERLVEQLRLPRDLSRHPLVQVIFILEDQRDGQVAGTFSLPQIQSETFTGDYRTVKYDLAMVVEDGADALAARLEYNIDLFEPSAIERLLSSFSELLADLAADPDRPLDTYALLSPAAHHQILREWNTTRGPISEATLASPFEAQVAQVGEQPAVITDDLTLSYAELNRRANRLARYLRAAGVGRGDLIGVYLDRSPEMFVAVLGVVKAGAAYVPFDAGWPEQRLRTILARMNIGWLLIGDDQLPMVERLTDLPRLDQVVCLDRRVNEVGAVPLGLPLATLSDLDQHADRDLAQVAGPYDLAYIIFTSGSTGEPKGVKVQHRAAINLIEWVNRSFAVGPRDRLLFVTALTFDLSVYDIFGMLASGGSVRLASRAELRDPERLTRILVNEPITFWDSAPAALQQLVGFLPTRDRLDHQPALRLIFLSGDWIPVSLPDRLRKTFSQAQVISLGGATEAAIWSNFFPIGEVDPTWPSIPYGRPITNARYHVLGQRLELCAVGIPGDLYISGDCLSIGYARSPTLTASKYLPDPVGESIGGRLYWTGDRARYLPDGNLQFLGRADTQVKVRGFRIELGEIEAVLGEQPGVREAIVLVREDSPGDQRLVAYFIPEHGAPPDAARLRAGLGQKLPEYMLPASYLPLVEWPLSPTGKLDRKMLPSPDAWRAAQEVVLAAPEVTPKKPETGSRGTLERHLVELWREILGVDQVASDDNFFELGGHSLLLVRVHSRLPEVLGRDVSMTDLFRYPTVGSLAAFLRDEDEVVAARDASTSAAPELMVERGPEIAVIGMAGRFATADSIEELWRKLCTGEEMIRFFTDDELRAAGFDEQAIADPRFVKARGALDNAELFDAAFFRISPREAQILDPQHRHFLECAYQALEVAGYGAESTRDRVGVYAGASANTYQPRVLAGSAEARAVGPFQLLISNNPDYLPTRVSYKLNLKGPSVNVQTACSTSLTAIHMACQGLLAGDCDLALAGGVSVAYREVGGHLFVEGGIQTPDGHTRAFDADANGVATGSGVGVVALKRLADAKRDGDTIRAVVLGTASNNDGALRAGFTAPGVEGQAEVIREAQIKAGVDPETVTYIEAHGTGTALGDPIEVAGLTQAFRAGTERRGYCALGSVKTNLGHLDAAAGVAGFIKTVMALEHREIPPSLNFRRPNPKIDFESTPFYVNSELASWPAGGSPRRAGVSAFGIGGTNAHAVLEEAPPAESPKASREWKILPLSARSAAALDAATARLAEALEADRDLDLADVAYTLQVGRQPFHYRRAVVCRNHQEAIAALTGTLPQRIVSGVAAPGGSSLAFLFPGQGAQHPGMALDIYRDEPVYRQHFDRCAAALEEFSGLDLRQLIDPESECDLDRTDLAQPVLFAVEYALAQLWRHWGVEPEAMLGHSLGEYVAACLAGVFSPEDGIRLVATRGQRMISLPAGAMLAVSLAANEAMAVANELARGRLSVATLSNPGNCVLSGETCAVEAVAVALGERGVTHRRLHTSHAFHSPMMEPVVAEVVGEAAAIDLRPPRIPYVSNLTGTWIRPEQATDPAYWGQHLRHTVLLDDGFAELFEPAGRRLLEVGPGRHLSTAARQHPGKEAASAIIHSLSPPGGRQSGAEALVTALGRLWTAGVEIDWRAYSASEQRRRVPLPTYPFERQRHWIDRLPDNDSARATGSTPASVAPTTGSAASTGSAATNNTEQVIAAAFSEILGVAEIDRHDDFFELGGSSLSALHLPSLLLASLGVELGATALLEAPTVALLAELVGERQEGQPERPSCLVRLNANGNASPLFMVHPVGGTIYWFRDLARLLDAGRPFYALQSPGLAAGDEPLSSVEDMATHYLAAVRQTQPRGPYVLGGSSMGGSVAFEMARQLRATGEDVALLVLLDSPCLDQLPPQPDQAEILASVFNGACPLPIDELRQLPETERLERVLQLAAEPTTDAAGAAAGQPAMDPDEIRRIYRVSCANVAALYAYEPKPQSLKALFFRALERRPVDAPRPELPWISLAEDGIDIQPVPGDHVSMNYPPNVAELAHRLRQRLVRA